MPIGPVQLIVVGFEHPDFRGEILDELEKLRESDTIGVLDALAVYKDADGNVEIAHIGNMTQEEAIEAGSTVASLLNFDIEGEETPTAGSEIEIGDEPEDAWDVIEEIPNDSAAALFLIEHRWIVPLRDAVARAGGFRIADGFISPLDLAEIGLIGRDEAEQMNKLARRAQATRA
ncbi:MAG TPA: hypothetical protein VLU96_04105 [Gaiellaceae bacterium]|nr:hypothetical protein [Gaiellaceae bacterium]